MKLTIYLLIFFINMGVNLPPKNEEEAQGKTAELL